MACSPSFAPLNRVRLWPLVRGQLLTSQAGPLDIPGTDILFLYIHSRDCLWIDQHRKQLRLPAPTYIDLVMSWVQGLVEDESIFPTKSGTFFFLCSIGSFGTDGV